MQPPSMFGGNTPWTYDQIQRQRQIADAMMMGMGTPQNVGEGLAAIGKALAIRGINRRADKEDAAGRAGFDQQWNSVLGGGGMGAAPAPGMGGSGPGPALPPTEGAQLGADTMAALGKPSPEPENWDAIRAGIFKGESGGDYDALFGYANRPGGQFQDVKLTNMTVDEALAFADPSGPYGQAVKGQIGRVATPMGAYQVVGTTLRAAKEGLGLKGNERMTAALQERIAHWIYKTQGTGAWEGYRGPASGGGGAPASPAGGGAPQMDMATLAEIAGNPYASPGQKAVAEALIRQQTQAMDPAYGLDLEYKRAQVDALRNPQPKDTRTDDQREYEYARSQGFQGTLQDWLVTQKQAGATTNNVNVNTGVPGLPPDEEELRKKLGGKEGEAWGGYLDAGSTAAGMMQDMQMLDELITMAPQGPITGRLAAAFPGVNSAADAFQSIVSRVAPSLRVTGSGATSDIEYEGMLKSLPRLVSQPDANAAISAMMKAKAQINIRRGEIVSAYQNGEASAADTRNALRELDRQSIMSPELKAILGTLGEGGDFADAPDDQFFQMNLEDMSDDELNAWLLEARRRRGE
jgi:hypothetical protein